MTDLNYQIALTNVMFDNSYRNVLRFDNRSEQEAYFNVNTLFSNSPEVNFNVGSFHATNVIYDCKDNESINELLNKNYCIIKDNTTNKNLNYFYYFVSNAKQECENRISLSLELDVMQTFYIDMQFTDCMINKAHLNRFIDNGDGTVSFDGTETSKLFEREDIKNVAKRLTKRSKVSFYDTSNNFGKWCEENILAWCYIYLQPMTLDEDVDITPKFTFWRSNNELQKFDTYFPSTKCLAKRGPISTNTAILVFPIMKLYSRIKLDNGDSSRTFYWGNSQTNQAGILEAFSMLNNGYGKVLTVKVSPYPPEKINITNYNIQRATILNLYTTLTVQATAVNSGMVNPFVNTLFSLTNGFRAKNGNTFCVTPATVGNTYSLVMTYIDNYEEEDTYDNYIVEKQFTFNKNEIIGANKNNKYNPKLLSNDYFELRLNDNTENGFMYDLQKLNNNTLGIKYTDSKTPDLQKIYTRFKASGLYVKETEENLTGFISSEDNSLILPTSAYQSMLANNKNYFMQNGLNMAFNLGMGAFKDVTSGNIAPTGTVTAGLSNIKDLIMQDLTIDNMKNAPENIVNAKGNIFFQNMYSLNGLIVEEYDILENEKEMINDYMCQYGFTYNRLDNIKNVDNIRKYYNYVRADIQEINSNTVNISHVIHDKFLEIFRNGVRFWNTDNFSYEKENYERWLENG